MFSEQTDLYQSVVMQRARSPHHMRRLEPFDTAAKGDNPMCGDRIEVRLRCDDGRITETAFEARGCVICIAAADLMVESVQGMTLEQVQELLGRYRILLRTGMCVECSSEGLKLMRPLAAVYAYPSRIKCATLPWDALVTALEGLNRE